jgi:hypothetical protein
MSLLKALTPVILRPYISAIIIFTAFNSKFIYFDDKGAMGMFNKVA